MAGIFRGCTVVSNQLSAEEYLLACAFDRGRQTFASEWFQKVVDGVNLEGAQRVLVMRGCEDNVWRWRGFAGTDLGGYIEAVHSGHLDVEEEELWFGDTDEIDCLGRRHSFPNYLYFRLVPQQLAELLTSEHFIIG
jgi:hypothetical protein